MIIANPIYDVVFKHLMANERVARFFISTLIEEEVEKLVFDPNEFTYENHPIGVKIFRMDYVCTIKLKSGERKKVLIEIQKAHDSGDIMRFRKYLGEQYKKDENEDEEEKALPILTIYILGFNLKGMDSACIGVRRNYTDLLSGQTILEKHPFIERLTHDSYIIQTQKISKKPATRLEKLLSIFEQSGFLDGEKTLKSYTHEIDLEEVQTMINILIRVGDDPKERERIEGEKEAWRLHEIYYGDQNRKLAQKDRIIEEKDKALEEQARLIHELQEKLNTKNN